MFVPLAALPENRLPLLKAAYAASFAVSSIVFMGILSGVDLLRSFISGYPEMRPITAVSFALIGCALAAWIHLSGAARLVIVRGVGALITLGAGVILAAVITKSGTGLDAFLLPDRQPVVDATSAFSPFNFLLLGASLLATGDRRAPNRIALGMLVLVLAGNFGAALAQLFHSPGDAALVAFGGVAIPTVALFLINAGVLITVNPESRFSQLLFSNSTGGRAARQLIPAVVLVPTLIGFLRVLGQEVGVLATGSGTTVSTFFCVVMMVAMVLFYSRKVHRADEERAGAEEELAKRESRYRDLFDYSQSITSTHDLTGKLLSINAAFVDSLGLPAEGILGRSYVDFIDERFRDEYAKYLQTVITRGEARGLATMVASSGKTLVWQYSNVLISEPDAEPYVLGSAIDVTALMKVQNELKRTSLTDELTGLYNRRGFRTLVDQQLKLEGHVSTARGLTLMFADMDGLKWINDTYGHEAGSDALRTLARTIKSVVRGGDIVARLGGDEFVILSIGANDQNAELVPERIQQRLAEYNAVSGKPYKVACSIGIVPVTLDHTRSFDDVLAEADEAMYAEKQRRKAGRSGGHEIFAGSSRDLMPDSLAWY